MEKATVSKLKNNSSAYLRKVRAGLLAARGITRPATHPLSSRELRTLMPHPLPRSACTLDALLEERAQDR
jgi:hypothetical protein